ncbi:hypothetical protein, partial [Acidithiobacillus sp. HP-2]|uniref:hypothetical protein n=1 Tax=Acidithiobacillus sp. HP-2 TaxID=2697654 RepID=UPI001D0D113D
AFPEVRLKTAVFIDVPYFLSHETGSKVANQLVYPVCQKFLIGLTPSLDQSEKPGNKDKRVFTMSLQAGIPRSY